MKFESFSKVVVNIAVTFFQAGVATWFATGFATDKLAVGAAVGAGASGVWNLVLKPLLMKAGYLV